MAHVKNSIVETNTDASKGNDDLSLNDAKDGKRKKYRKTDLSIDEIRSEPMFAHFTDAQAKEVIDTIKELTIIIFRASRRQS